jgi:hypothetical protein
MFLEHHICTGEVNDASVMRSFMFHLQFFTENINPIIKVLIQSHTFNFSGMLIQRDVNVIWWIPLIWTSKKEVVKCRLFLTALA